MSKQFSTMSLAEIVLRIAHLKKKGMFQNAEALQKVLQRYLKEMNDD